MSQDWQRDLKCALRDLGLAARKAKFSLPEAADIMRHIHDCEDGLKDLVEGKPFVEMNKDENVRRLNTARSEWYVELGRAIYDAGEPDDLPENLRSLVENVTRLEVKRHLVGPPKSTSDGQGAVSAPVMGPGSSSRMRFWANLAFSAAALAAVAVTVWMMYAPTPGGLARRAPSATPEHARNPRTEQPPPPNDATVPPPPTAVQDTPGDIHTPEDVAPDEQTPPSFRPAEGIALADMPDAGWDDVEQASVLRAVAAAPNDPVSAFLELQSILQRGAEAATPARTAWLEEQMAALKPSACAMLQSDFDVAVAAHDVHSAVVIMAVAARLDGSQLNGVERLATARQALFDGAPSAYRVWELADVQTQRLAGGRYIEAGGQYTLTPNVGFELVRVRATATNIAADGERPYSRWALSEAQRALALRAKQDPDTPATRNFARNYAFLMGGDGQFFECSFIPVDSPIRGSQDGAGSLGDPVGVAGMDCPPIPVARGESITFDGIFGVPKGATGLRLWISGAVPLPAPPSDAEQ